MKKELFSPMEIDAIGEMMNISLGSSATAVSNLLDQRVDITTPEVTVVEVEDFSIGNLEPAMGVEIKYVEGLEGSNIMLLRRSDIKVIVDILMGGETPEEEFELNDLTISAVCEVMNQMMGAASTAMSDFLGFPVNISTPLPFELKSLQEFKENHLPQGAKTIVVVRFSLKIEKALESEFMNVMSVSLAKELLAGLGLEEEDDCPAPAEPSMASGGGKQLSQEEIEKMMAGSWGEAPAEPLQQPPSASSEPADQLTQTKPAASEPAMQTPAPVLSGNPSGVTIGGYPPYYPYPPYPYPLPAQVGAMPPDPKVINTMPVDMPEMDAQEVLGKEQAENLDLIMEVPLQITVEIGRTQRKVQEILGFSKGSLDVLDKLAGDQVDLFVNGKCIAKGDVVVIDDNFGIRITEIVKKPGLMDSIKK